jgi:hypothetical protein
MPRWLGKLLTPAEDPRRGVEPVPAPDASVLVASLRQARDELSALRTQIEARAPRSPIAQQLDEEEQELLAAEAALLLELDERRALAALRRAAEARIRAL